MGLEVLTQSGECTREFNYVIYILSMNPITEESDEMVTKKDRDLAISVLDKYIPSGKEKEWLDWLLYTDNVEDEFIVGLKKTLTEISPSMNWNSGIGFEIPEQEITSMIVECLGSNFLRSEKIRGYLCKRYLNVESDEKINNLMVNIGVNNTEELYHKIVNNFSPSSKQMFSFSKELEIPRSFVVKNPVNKKPAFKRTRTTRKLHDLTDFQQIVKNKLVQNMEKDFGRAMVVMPTGSGKTRTSVQAFIEAMSNDLIPRNGIVWIADKDELCEQAFDTIDHVSEALCPFENDLWRYWESNDILLSEIEGDNIVTGIVVCGKAQLQLRMDKNDPNAESIILGANVIIVDEAHRNLDWLEAINSYLKQNKSTSTLIGLSATPFRRLGHESARLQEIFPNELITPVECGSSDFDVITEEMVKRKILARRVDKEPEEYGIVLGNSYDPETTIRIIQALIKDGHESILVFTQEVRWGKICSMIMSLKYPDFQIECLFGGTPDKSRKDIIQAFRIGDCKVLFNCEILTTGFDAPRIDAVVIARNTDPNDPLFYQMVGRGLRGPRWDPENVKDHCTIVHQRW